MQESQDLELAERIRAGDRAAYADLVNQYQDAVRSFTAIWSPSSQEADDIAQEVFLIALKNIHTLEPDRDLKTWLLGVASNLTKKAWRRVGRSKQAPSGVALDEMLSQQALAVFQQREARSNDRQEALAHCIERLPEKTKSIFFRYVVDELSSEELGAELKMSEGTVRATISRIRLGLRDCILRRLQTETAR